jgi:hypothetical protein
MTLLHLQSSQPSPRSTLSLATDSALVICRFVAFASSALVLVRGESLEQAPARIVEMIGSAALLAGVALLARTVILLRKPKDSIFPIDIALMSFAFLTVLALLGFFAI